MTIHWLNLGKRKKLFRNTPCSLYIANSVFLILKERDLAGVTKRRLHSQKRSLMA